MLVHGAGRSLWLKIQHVAESRHTAHDQSKTLHLLLPFPCREGVLDDISEQGHRGEHGPQHEVFGKELSLNETKGVAWEVTIHGDPCKEGDPHLNTEPGGEGAKVSKSNENGGKALAFQLKLKGDGYCDKQGAQKRHDRRVLGQRELKLHSHDYRI